MSNPFKEEARKTNRAKLHASGVHKDSEDVYSRAQRIAKGYADGGGVEPQPKDLYSSGDLNRVSDPKNMGVAPMPTIKSPDTGDRMNADTSANTPSFLKGKTPR